MISSVRFAFSVSVLALAATQSATAGTVADFFAGKQIVAEVPSSPGGSFDEYMRLLADHLGEHIPGKPKIIVQNMPGGGGVKELNYLYNVAPKNGLYLGIPVHTTLTFGLLNPKKVKFRGPDFSWIGSMSGIHDVIVVLSSSPVKTIADARKTVVPMGATGRGGNTYLDVVMANNLLGTKFKIILGYPGANEVNLAIERGEVQGRASSWEGLVAIRPQWITQKKITTLVQIGPNRIPELGDTPRFRDLLKNPADGAVVDVLSVGYTMGRAVFTTPGVPADRVAALRKAFDDMVVDKAYLADAKKRHMTAEDPTTGVKLQDVVDAVYKSPKDVIARAQDALTPH